MHAPAPNVIANALFLTLTGTVVVAGLWGGRAIRTNHANDREDQIRYYSSLISTLGVVAWPLVFNHFVGFQQMLKQPATLFGLLWPMAILLTQLKSDRVDLTDDHLPIVPSTYKDTGIIISVVLSLATLLISAWPTEAKGNKQAVIKMLMYAVMLSIAFILPLGDLTGDDHEPSTASTVLQSSQRVFLNYALGFVILAVAIFLTGPQK